MWSTGLHLHQRGLAEMLSAVILGGAHPPSTRRRSHGSDVSGVSDAPAEPELEGGAAATFVGSAKWLRLILHAR